MANRARTAIASFMMKQMQTHVELARPPDEIVGVNYMDRWYVIPRNKYFNIYLHRFSSSDANTMHDHPWWSVSFILAGKYLEHTPLGDFLRTPGSITCRGATSLHWLEVHQPTHSLFITGRHTRVWGFQCSKKWIPWHEYIDSSQADKTANGCGETL